MNSGMRATGTETSFLMLPPSGFCASEMDSRRRQKSRAWASERAIAASTMSPRSLAASSASVSSRSAVPSALSPEVSSSTYQGCRAAKGSRVPGVCFSTRSSTMPAMTSNAVSVWPAVS